MVLTVLVGPGSVSVSCPMCSLRCDCGDSHIEIVRIATITGFCGGNLKGPPRRPGRRWEDIIKVDLTEIGWGRDWINLARLMCCVQTERHHETVTFRNFANVPTN